MAATEAACGPALVGGFDGGEGKGIAQPRSMYYLPGSSYLEVR